MGGKSDYLGSRILDHVLAGQAFPQPTPFLALFTGDPTAGAAELSGSGYVRVNASGAWGQSVGSPSQRANNVDVAFGVAAGDWRTVTHFGVFDAFVGGNLLYWSALDTPQTVVDGTTAVFRVGALVVQEQ